MSTRPQLIPAPPALLPSMLLLSVLSLSGLCGCGGGDGGAAPATSDVGSYGLDVPASLSLNDLGAGSKEQDALDRANRQALRVEDDPRFGLNLLQGGTFILRLGTDEEARGTWSRAKEQIVLSTMTFDGHPVVPPEVSEADIVEPGRLRFSVGSRIIELRRR